MGNASSCPLVLLVLDSNNFCCVNLVHPTVSSKCILHLWGQSEAFATSTISSWVFTAPCTLGHALFVGLYLPLIYFSPFIMNIGWMVHVHSIKFTFTYCALVTTTNTKGMDPNKSYAEGINSIESWRVNKSKDKITRDGQDWWWWPKHNM